MAYGDGRAVVAAGGLDVSGFLDDGSAVGGFDLRNFEGLPAREVPVGALSGGVLVRQGGTSPAHVQLLIDAAAPAASSGGPGLPPILVQNDTGRIIDGLHRLEVARLR